jgi:hypothetical protein
VPRSGQLADLALLDRIHRRAGKQQLRHGLGFRSCELAW